MPTIYLLRHGQASFGTDDYDVLSDLGEKQVRIAAAELQHREIRTPMFVSGTLKRQKGTVAIAAEILAGTVSGADARWNEIDAHVIVDRKLGHAGASAGLTSTAFQQVLDEALVEMIETNDPEWLAFADGAFGALTDLGAALPRGCDAVVGTSAGVIAAIVGRLLGCDAQGVVALNRVSVNASLTTIAVSPKRLSLLAFNEQSHLSGVTGLKTYR